MGSTFRRMNPRSMCIFYLLLGFVMNYPKIPMRVFLIDVLEIDVVEFASIEGMMILPWILKPVYGMISDRFPLCGTRRKGYIVLMNILAGVLWCSFLLNTSIYTNVSSIVILLLSASMLTCFADVMYDSIIVEYAQREKNKGTLQTYCWMARSFGSILGTIIGGALCQQFVNQIHVVLSMTSVIHFTTVLFCLRWVHEREQETRSQSNVIGIVRKVVTAIRNPTLWKPILFVLLFLASPSSNDAFTYFLIEELHFSPNILVVLSCLGHIGMLIGARVYQKMFSHWRLRQFFILMILLSTISSFSPLLLVFKINKHLHIPDAIFAAGDDFFLSTLGEITFMPCLILAAQMAPKGIEATMYALIVSLVNFSSLVSDYGGVALASLFQVSREDFSNLSLMMVVCCLSTLICLSTIRCVPNKTIQNLSICHEENNTYASVDQDEDDQVELCLQKDKQKDNDSLADELDQI